MVRAEPEGMRSFWAISKAADIRFVETNSDKFHRRAVAGDADEGPGAEEH